MKYLFLILVFFLNISLHAQDTIKYKGENINALDELGRHNGVWKIYDDEQNIVIIIEFDKGVVIKGPMYYKDSKLIAIKKDGEIEIYDGGKTIKAHFHTEPSKMPVLVDNEGTELDKKSYKYLLGPVYPKFYGGNDELYEFMRKSINHKTLKKQKGKVKVGFVIDTIGKVSQIKILESTNPAINEEVKRIISILPRWQPAYQNGELVRIAFTIPFEIN